MPFSTQFTYVIEHCSSHVFEIDEEEFIFANSESVERYITKKMEDYADDNLQEGWEILEAKIGDNYALVLQGIDEDGDEFEDYVEYRVSSRDLITFYR